MPLWALSVAAAAWLGRGFLIPGWACGSQAMAFPRSYGKGHLVPYGKFREFPQAEQRTRRLPGFISPEMERMFGTVLRSGGFWWFLLGTSKRLGAGRLWLG